MCKVNDFLRLTCSKYARCNRALASKTCFVNFGRWKSDGGSSAAAFTLSVGRPGCLSVFSVGVAWI